MCLIVFVLVGACSRVSDCVRVFLQGLCVCCVCFGQSRTLFLRAVLRLLFVKGNPVLTQRHQLTVSATGAAPESV